MLPPYQYRTWTGAPAQTTIANFAFSYNCGCQKTSSSPRNYTNRNYFKDLALHSKTNARYAHIHVACVFSTPFSSFVYKYEKSSIPPASERIKNILSTFRADKMLRKDTNSREFWPNRMKCITFGTMTSSAPVTLSKLSNLCDLGGTITIECSSRKRNQIIHTNTKATMHHIYRLRILTLHHRRQAIVTIYLICIYMWVIVQIRNSLKLQIIQPQVQFPPRSRTGSSPLFQIT
jgi:hypothetical protein